MARFDLAVRWNDNRGGLARIRALGRVPVCGFPYHLTIPDGKVALVTKGGNVSPVFQTNRIEGPKLVKLPDGKRRKGYIIRAKKGSIHPPREKDPHRLGIRWYAIGQFRYFNARTGKPVLINRQDFGAGPYLEDDTELRRHISFRAFTGAIPGLPRHHPEAQLVTDFVKWLNDPDGFGQNYIREARLFVDLFDRRKWRLIEAKASADREHVRTAVGQLLDYRRFYAKRPSLGVLLSKMPSPACLRYLGETRITAVWRTPAGRFRDSTAQRLWTLQRRRKGWPRSRKRSTLGTRNT